MKKIGILFIVMLFISGCSQEKIQASVDLVIFSYNRPLQLYALLEPTQKNISGINAISVVYRADSQEFHDGYEIVKSVFSNVVYLKQGPNPDQDFKILTLQAFERTSAPYIMFAVDDIVVRGKVDLSECINYLEKYNAYGFYLRLGKNLSYCYSINRSQPIPHLYTNEDKVYSWQFSNGQLDWAYPHTVDMTIYKKENIKFDLINMHYATPNQLEGVWSMRANKIMRQKGLCFAESKIVNLPLNRVQNDFNNRTTNFMTPQRLLSVFQDGMKMKIDVIENIDVYAAHMDYSPSFIER